MNAHLWGKHQLQDHHSPANSHGRSQHTYQQTGTTYGIPTLTSFLTTSSQALLWDTLSHSASGP